MIVWHYTTGEKLYQIVRDSVIKPATAFVPIGERPIVWFSTAPVWEETANKRLLRSDGKIVSLDRDGTHVHGGGLIRIGVAPETAPYKWELLKAKAHMTPRMAKGLIKAAHKCGAKPSEWRGTFEPVPFEKWIALEVWDGIKWVSAESDSSNADGERNQDHA
jgi:hypothetical protein